MAEAAVIDTRNEYEQLFALYVPIALAVTAVVFGVVIFALVRYRRRPGREPSGPAQMPRLELGYALLLTGVVAALLAFTFSTEARVDRVSNRPGLVVRVTASQWLWRFDYPAYGITRIGGDIGPVDLVVPTDTEIEFRMTSLDVIHAFFVPAVRYKIDAYPDRVQRFDLVFDEPGVMKGYCAEFCGLNHADMSFTVKAVSPEGFRAWAEREADRP